MWTLSLEVAESSSPSAAESSESGTWSTGGSVGCAMTRASPAAISSAISRRRWRTDMFPARGIPRRGDAVPMDRDSCVRASIFLRAAPDESRLTGGLHPSITAAVARLSHEREVALRNEVAQNLLSPGTLDYGSMSLNGIKPCPTAIPSANWLANRLSQMQGPVPAWHGEQRRVTSTAKPLPNFKLHQIEQESIP